jgi:hypothetical protein
MTQTSEHTGEWVTGERGDRFVIQTASRVFRLPAVEPPEQLRVRRLAVHPDVIVDKYAIRERLDRGACGCHEVMIQLCIPNETLADDRVKIDGEDRGDCGGPGDRGIAAAARELTKCGPAEEVIESLARHHVHTVADLRRALGLEPGQVMSLEMRAEIGQRLGFVEPRLPEWAASGEFVVGRSDQLRRLRRIDVTGSDGVLLEGSNERIPAGVFIVMYEPAVTCGKDMTQDGQ